MFAVALREGIEVVIVVVQEVKRARSRTSEGGRKITGAEWRVIMSAAAAQLVSGLTSVFAPWLDQEAIASFSDDDDKPARTA
jgi:hypothetical protein